MNAWLAVAVPGDTYRLDLDGDYGPITDAVTRRFQVASGLPIDGIVGPATRAAVLSSPALIDAGAGLAAHDPSVAAGDHGPAVADWQRDLDVWFDATGAVPGGVAVDGVFGPLTQDATLAFQRAQGVTVDGIVGPETRAALLSAPALANPAPAAPPRTNPATTPATTPVTEAPLTPAAGVCESADTTIVVIHLAPDVPTPRCVTLNGRLHWLQIVNDGAATRVTLGSFTVDLAAGATVTTDLPVRAYVDPGSQTLIVARYDNSGPDIVVQ